MNYRGITTTLVIMKIMGRIVLKHQELASPSVIHSMQLGFTEGCLGQHAAFILAECMAEARGIGQPLLVRHSCGLLYCGVGIEVYW